jgi:hypothetical protein
MASSALSALAIMTHDASSSQTAACLPPVRYATIDQAFKSPFHAFFFNCRKMISASKPASDQNNHKRQIGKNPEFSNRYC